MRRITQTIAFRLFVLIASVQTVILLGLTYAVVHVQQTNSMGQIIESTLRVSDVIARSTRYSMLLNRKEDVHNIITSVGGEPGIQGIRIYNKQGEIIFGTVPSEIHTAVDMNAEACIRCHPGGLENPQPPVGDPYRIFTTASGSRVLGMITPIRNEEQCATADCHAHPASKTILGVLDVKMSLAQVDQNLAESKQQLLMMSILAVILISLAAGAFLWLFVRRPVKRLMAGMEMVAAGRLDHRLEASGKDELEQLARTFNDMTGDLARARAEITAWSETLEQKVKEKTADLENAHRQMVRVEKMASLGNLASSVAHELNNPLEGILTFAKLIIKKLKKLSLPQEELDTYRQELQLIADEAQRCGNIVKNLLVFARQRRVAFQRIHFREVLDRCVLLVNHHAQMNNVRIESSCTEDDTVECDPDQMQQVLIALMVNAIEAMPPQAQRAGDGLLRIEARREPGTEALVIRVADNGTGMGDEVKAHVFEPFFTTKSEAKGVGLGLAITYGIIQRHHGTIDVESAVGRGTTFTIVLPARQPEPNQAAALSSSMEGARL